MKKRNRDGKSRKKNSPDITKGFAGTKAGLYVLMFLSMVIFTNDLSRPGLPSYDDCTKAQRAVEMLETGNLVTPHYAGEPNFDHPPFYFWMLSLSFLAFGKTEFAARLFGALCGLFLVLVSYKLGEEIKSRTVGWFAGFFLVTSYMVPKLARRVATDIPFALFASLALLFFLRMYKLSLKKKTTEKEKKQLLTYSILYGLSVGISGLIKSVFVVFPLLSPLIFLIIQKKFAGKIFRYYLIGSALGVVTAGWWYIAEFIIYGKRFIDEFFGQFLGGHAGGMSNLGEFGPLGYFWEFARHFWFWLPLTIFAIWLIFKNGLLKKESSLQMLAVFFAFPFILLSIPADKSIRYVIFLFVPLLVATAYVLYQWIDRKKIDVYSKYAVIFLTLISAFVLIRPIDWEDIRNEDYILLAEKIRRGEVKPQNTNIYLYRGDYSGNRQPMLFYTGYDLKDVAGRKKRLVSLLKSEGRFMVLVRNEDIDKFFNRNFVQRAKLKERTLMLSRRKHWKPSGR